MDAAARELGIELRIVALGLLGVVLPVAGGPAEDVLGARRGLGLQLGEHLVLAVVVLEVVGGDRVHLGRDPQLATQRARELGVVLAPLPGLGYERHRVHALVLVHDAPAGMVETDHDRLELVGDESAGPGDLVREVDRALAERDERHARVRRHGLREDVDRIGVVEDPRLRADVLDVGEDALHRVDGPQRHEEAARPLRLLADDAVLERDALVQHTRRKAARPIARKNRIAVGEARTSIGRGRDREVEAARLRHALRQPADQVEPVGVEVDEHDFRALEVLALVDEARHRARAARGAAADIRHLDACHLTLPGSARSAGRGRGDRPPSPRGPRAGGAGSRCRSPSFYRRRPPPAPPA